MTRTQSIACWTAPGTAVGAVACGDAGPEDQETITTSVQQPLVVANIRFNSPQVS